MAGLSASPSLTLERRGRSRRARWDAVMVTLAAVQGALLIAAPGAPAIALGVWWNSNTISHNFIHRPFFRARWANLLFGIYLSVLLGIPQRLWRDRHLAHHAGVEPRLAFSGECALQASLILFLWILIAARAPGFFFSVYLPGYLAGLGLCWLHGYYEHARGTTSYYGKLYNLLFFNDGHHAEHHARPGLHWTRLPEYYEPAVSTSKWPAPLRWMEAFSLETLENLVLRSPTLQRFVLSTHARALRDLIRPLPSLKRVTIVGGGLFPRTALILSDLLPAAHISIIDANPANLDRARALLGNRSIDFISARYAQPGRHGCDLLVIPLSFDGDRRALYADPPAPAVLLHDWLWRKRGSSRVVSIALLKRVNLVRP